LIDYAAATEATASKIKSSLKDLKILH
jgi:hypothetical protein